MKDGAGLAITGAKKGWFRDQRRIKRDHEFAREKKMRLK
jgi:hypothetical protein